MPKAPLLPLLAALLSAPLCSLLGAGAPGSTGAAPRAFEGARALEQVRQVVALGPRSLNSPGLEACRAHIRAQVQALGLRVEEHPFTALTPAGPARMVNLSVFLPGRLPGKGRILLGGHYDTKRLEFPFLGANDGGSSTGFLLELLRVLKERPRKLGLEVVFFDGEEAVRDWTHFDHTYGSQEYVRQAQQAGRLGELRALVLVDMIGDADLDIRRDPGSTPWLTDLIWAAAHRLGKQQQFLDEELPVDDDHAPFLAAGVPAVDIIDLDYPAWHRAEDTLDKLSAASLQVVGEVLLEALPHIERHLLQQP